MSRGEIAALTGVRGVAAAGVVLYHFYPADPGTPPLLRHVFGRGYLCVDLFFVLSGLVLALNYGAEFARTAGMGATLQRFRGFLLRRIGRIWPLYAALIVGRYVYTLAEYGSLTAPATRWPGLLLLHPVWLLATNLGLVQAWGISESILGPAWSVSTEWGAYMLFPLLCRAALDGSRWRALGACAGATGLILGVAIASLHDGEPHMGMLDLYDPHEILPLLRCVGGFTLGMLGWRMVSWPAAARRLGMPWVGAAVLAALGLVVWFGAPDLAIYPLLPLLVMHLAVGRGPAVRLFSCRPALALGALSYSMYLLHGDLLPFFWAQVPILARWMPPLAASLLAGAGLMALVLACSLVTWRGLEVPVRRVFRALPQFGAGITGRVRMWLSGD